MLHLWRANDTGYTKYDADACARCGEYDGMVAVCGVCELSGAFHGLFEFVQDDVGPDDPCRVCLGV